MKSRINRWMEMALMGSMVGWVACGPAGEGPDGTRDTRPPAPEAEAIDTYNDPSAFSEGLNRKFDALPLAGEAKQIPWPGSYWPVYQDAINNRWAGPQTLSPAAKYSKAFGVAKVEDAVSRLNGVASQAHAKACKTDSECDPKQGEVCGFRNAASKGRCIPTWFGLCHAWAPAAILEPEPIRSVTYNGVEFKVNDIKGLITMVYNGVDSRFLSGRCEESKTGGSLETDATGRPTNSECRDTNPGTFHIVVANYLGLKGQSFVEDRTFDSEVWNQPMRGYQVVEKRDVSFQEANKLLKVGGNNAPTTYSFNDQAVRLVYLRTVSSYIGESDVTTDGNLAGSIGSYTFRDSYEYILELDQKGDILGGEWVGKSRTSHPDFLWLPTTLTTTSIAGIKYEDVKKLLDLARATN